MTTTYLPGNTLLPEEEQRDTSTLVPLASSTSVPSALSGLPPSALSGLPAAATTAALSGLPLAPIIVLGSNDMNDTTLFLNGLTQNIAILYELFESLGYRPYLLQNPQPQGAAPEKKEFIRTMYRTTTASEMVTYGLPVRLFIEIGMSLDPPTRGYLRGIGATLVKLYLGNILNIDVETIQYYPSMFFHHHIVGELDEIWTSPHYKQHLEYAAILNRTEPERARIVPYVWEPSFLTRYRPLSALEWCPPSPSSTPSVHQDIVIMDPNISFQKCSFYSVLLADAYARRHPEWKGTLHIVNGDRLHLQSHAKNQLLPALTLHQQGRIRYTGRKRIHEILEEHRSACFITHQWNNDYNYMILELMYCQYPILHHSEGWKDYGYAYSIDRWDEAVDLLHTALTRHKDNLPVYKSHVAQLLQRHSIYDPEVRRRWKGILDASSPSPSS